MYVLLTTNWIITWDASEAVAPSLTIPPKKTRGKMKWTFRLLRPFRDKAADGME